MQKKRRRGVPGGSPWSERGGWCSGRGLGSRRVASPSPPGGDRNRGSTSQKQRQHKKETEGGKHRNRDSTRQKRRENNTGTETETGGPSTMHVRPDQHERTRLWTDRAGHDTAQHQSWSATQHQQQPQHHHSEQQPPPSTTARSGRLDAHADLGALLVLAALAVCDGIGVCVGGGRRLRALVHLRHHLPHCKPQRPARHATRRSTVQKQQTAPSARAAGERDRQTHRAGKAWLHGGTVKRDSTALARLTPGTKP
eukprot:2968886-Rhodomonas_salina.1